MKDSGTAHIQLSKEQVTRELSVHVLTGRLFIPVPVFTYTYKPQLDKLRLNESAD